MKNLSPIVIRHWVTDQQTHQQSQVQSVAFVNHLYEVEYSHQRGAPIDGDVHVNDITIPRHTLQLALDLMDHTSLGLNIIVCGKYHDGEHISANHYAIDRFTILEDALNVNPIIACITNSNTLTAAMESGYVRCLGTTSYPDSYTLTFVNNLGDCVMVDVQHFGQHHGVIGPKLMIHRGHAPEE